MKFPSLLLLAAYLAVCCVAVNGEQNYKQQDDVSNIRTTRAPLMTSTAAPTKQTKVKKISKVPIATAAKPAIKKDMDTESLPIKSPAMVDHPLEAEESTPLAVTGFLTKNGNIYEIENSNGIGKIESRQAHDDAQHICNYGAVVVYSDVPCEMVNNIKIREIEDKPSVESTPASVLQQENSAEDNEIKPHASNLNRPNKNGQKRPSRPGQNRPNKPAQNRPNQSAQNRPNKRPSQNGQKRPSQSGQNRPSQNGQKRPSQNGQKRPSQNGQNRPNQNGPKRPNKNNQKRPIQNGQKRPNNNVTRPNINGQNSNTNKSRRAQQYNQRKWEEEEYDDDDDDRYYYQGNRRRNQAHLYVSDYDDY